MSVCKETGCDVSASYNYEGKTNCLYCATHKKDGMINVKNKRCLEPNCKKQPNYNYEGKTYGLYCATHKKDGMIDVKNKRCLETNCKTRAQYNYENETKGIYCATHKKDGMIDVKNKHCLEPNCKTRPNYNYEGKTNGLYCTTHKKDGMIDVKHKHCLEPNCKTRPNYNYEGEIKGIYCTTHKKEGMINVNNKRCLEPNCKTRPNYNYEGKTYGLYCTTHKKEGMINVINKRCTSQWCNTQVTDKYDGYCLYCFMHLFPDKPVSCNYKTKEYSVVEHVTNEFSDLPWVADKIIQGGCSKRRPDLMLDLIYQVIIIEIDENQHIEYDCSCQNKRIMELSQDVGHRPLVFIRFNPDEYDNGDETVASCWGINQKGICVVKKSKCQEWTQRLQVLDEHINYWINPVNVTNKTIETIQLYYDTN